MKPSKLATILLSVTITTLIVAFVAFADWNNPTANPPSDNTPTPINAGGIAQIKSGGLIVGADLTSSQTALVVPNGNALIGTMVERSAPNGLGGNANVNDLYIRSIGKWASELTLGEVASHGSTTYNVPGTYSFVAPAGVSSVEFEAWGAGGGGMGSCQLFLGHGVHMKTGGGGGGGAYMRKTVAVVPGNAYAITVGAGGSGSEPVSNGNAADESVCLSGGRGGDSSFGTEGIAPGGKGAYRSGVSFYGGAGGYTVLGSNGDNGANGSTVSGAAAGGDGGSAASGGGAGGTGMAASAGGNGSTPGGGGAGGGTSVTTGFRGVVTAGVYYKGGNGSGGRVILSW